MLNDFKMIVHKLDKSLKYANIYPISDVHIGSPECNITEFKKAIDIIQNDENGYLIIAGDMLNNGIKSSKSNCYEETMRPREQKEVLYEYLKPIKNKILACCGGNHCYRNIKEVDNNPLYDVMCRLDIAELYRENACFVKISLGQRENKQRQITYAGVITHGATQNKHNQFAYSIDGADFIVSGHTHNADYSPKGKLRIDSKNNTVTQVGFKQIINHSFLDYGGYGLRAEYKPTAPIELPKLKLCGEYKKMWYTEE